MKQRANGAAAPAPAGNQTSTMTPLKVVGQSTPRIDAPERVTGRAKYTNDIQLPGMNGIQLVQELAPRLPQTKIVVC